MESRPGRRKTGCGRTRGPPARNGAAPLRPRTRPPGFRERFLADPSFLVKLGIECGIGVCTKVRAPPLALHARARPARGHSWRRPYGVRARVWACCSWHPDETADPR